MELDPILESVNRQLPRKHNIHKDDPIIGLIVLHKELLKTQSEAGSKQQEEFLSLYNAAAEKHTEIAKNLSNHLINKAGDFVSAQIKETIQSGLEEIQTAKQKATNDLHESFFATKLGGYGFLMAGCLTAGAALYHFILTLGWVHK
jgi:hypothetical protein